MAKKPKRPHKTDRLTESPIALRLPADLLARVDGLVDPVAADADTATLLGGVTRSAVLRYALLEGVKTLERRYSKA